VKAVNLLPRDETSAGARRLDPLVVGGAVLLVAVVGGTAGGYMLEHKRAGSEQTQLASAQAQLAAAQARLQQLQSHPKKPILPTPSVTSQEKPWRDAVASALSTRIAFDRALLEFERVVPSDVTVSDLTMGAPGAATSSGTTTTAGSAPTTGTTGGGSFTLSGKTFSEDSVARLLSRLMLVPDLTGVSLQTSTTDPQTGIVTFAISAQVKGAPVTAAPATAAPASTDSTSTSATTTTSGGSA
jgi:Tfp pilus assembly protein PilN